MGYQPHSPYSNSPNGCPSSSPLSSDSMAKLGLAGGITTQILAASAAVYTLYLLSALYHEFKRSLVRSK